MCQADQNNTKFVLLLIFKQLLFGSLVCLVWFQVTATERTHLYYIILVSSFNLYTNKQTASVFIEWGDSLEHYFIRYIWLEIRGLWRETCQTQGEHPGFLLWGGSTTDSTTLAPRSQTACFVPVFGLMAVCLCSLLQFIHRVRVRILLNHKWFYKMFWRLFQCWSSASVEVWNPERSEGGEGSKQAEYTRKTQVTKQWYSTVALVLI